MMGDTLNPMAEQDDHGLQAVVAAVTAVFATVPLLMLVLSAVHLWLMVTREGLLSLLW